MPSKKIEFLNSRGNKISGNIEFPLTQKPDAYAVFSHVFTGSKNLNATRNISRSLTLNGIAVLRFDFTGLGDSEGDFSETNFSTNVDDIKSAANFLSENYIAPKILIGHSLGGAAAIFAAKEIDSIEAVSTIGAPSEPEHVTHLFGLSMKEIEENGQAEVTIGGRTFMIKKQFIDDIRSVDLTKITKSLNKALLILHSPQDGIVEIENAAKIYHAASHPKSFVTLDKADHMLTHKDDAYYAGNVISSWVRRYIPLPKKEELSTTKQVVAKLGKHGYTTDIMAGNHGFVADESEDLGGQDFGPSPYEILNAALGACTAMTLQMYARRKKWPLEDVKVHLSFDRSYKEDCNNCSDDEAKLGLFEVQVEMTGDLDQEQRQRLLEIARRCPVHRTISSHPAFQVMEKPA